MPGGFRLYEDKRVSESRTERQNVLGLPQALDHNGFMLLLPSRSMSSHSMSVDAATSRWWPWGAALVVWLSAGFMVAYLVLQVVGRGPNIPVPVTPVVSLAVDSQAVARALGARGVQAAPVLQTVSASRYVLEGVVAPVPGAQPSSGVALIAVDGQRPGTYRVGAELDGRWTVLEVQRRAVLLQSRDSAGERTTLSLPTSLP